METNPRRKNMRLRSELRRAYAGRKNAQRKLDQLRDTLERVLCDLDDMTRGQTRARLSAAWEDSSTTRIYPHES